MTPILAATAWKTNGEMIADCARLGYLDKDWSVLDPTYGTKGTFWKVWEPPHLTRHDLALDGVDFRALPYPSRSFDAVVFDPPYKLNGTATPEVDARYGVAEYAPRADRHKLILDGITECARVSRRMLLIKCMDQVNSGKVRWQSREFADHAEAQGFRLVDQLLRLGGRPQPEGRTQVHARRNYSTLLILERVGS